MSLKTKGDQKKKGLNQNANHKFSNESIMGFCLLITQKSPNRSTIRGSVHSKVHRDNLIGINHEIFIHTNWRIGVFSILSFNNLYSI